MYDVFRAVSLRGSIHVHCNKNYKSSSLSLSLSLRNCHVPLTIKIARSQNGKQKLWLREWNSASTCLFIFRKTSKVCRIKVLLVCTTWEAVWSEVDMRHFRTIHDKFIAPIDLANLCDCPACHEALHLKNNKDLKCNDKDHENQTAGQTGDSKYEVPLAIHQAEWISDKSCDTCSVDILIQIFGLTFNCLQVRARVVPLVVTKCYYYAKSQQKRARCNDAKDICLRSDLVEWPPEIPEPTWVCLKLWSTQTIWVGRSLHPIHQRISGFRVSLSLSYGIWVPNFQATIGNPNPSEVGMFAGPQPQVQTWVSEASPALLAALPPRHGLVVGTRPSTPGKGRPSTGPSMPRGM